jgi:uncharacterized protein YlaI/DNA-binding XRE family transcriptional regulator
MRKINIPKDLLVEMYVEKGMTTYEIADELGTSRQTINNKLKEYGVELRNSLFQPKLKKKSIKRVKQADYKDKETFEKVYKEMKSLDLVSEFFGINLKTAYLWKKQHGIETIKQLSASGYDRRMEGKPWYDKEYLSEMYEQYSTYELAQMWNCDPTTIQKWLRKHNIPRKTLGEQWRRKPKNGISIVKVDGFDLKAYESKYNTNIPLSKQVAESIKELVGECQSCGEKDVLDLHHINENRRDNRPENHVVLCPNCHARIHRLGKTVDELVPNFKDWSNSYAEAK